MKILIIDDEATNIDILSDIFKQEYDLFAALSGEEALKRLSTENLPDLVLLDIRMPGMDGFEVCRSLKKNLLTQDVPVIFVTSMEDAVHEKDGIEAGAVDYIRRPFDAAVVRSRVRLHLELHLVRRESENRYRMIFNHISDMVVIFSAYGAVLAANRSFYEQTGYAPDDIAEMAAADLGLGVFLPLDAVKLDRIRENRIESLEDEMQRRDGARFPVEIRTRLIHFDGREAALSILRDITARKENERLLADYRNRLEDLVETRTRELREKEKNLVSIEKKLHQRRRFQNMIGSCEAMQAVFDQLEELADIGSTVIISGESGAGKELAAQALHYGGIRRNRPFTKVVCSDLTEQLIGSEIFGHVKGAFTGAVTDRKGRLHNVGDGTLFLDEIGDIPPEFQKKLLRVIEERTFERIGDDRTFSMDARIIVASNVDLAAQVRAGKFREDLYYRLKVMELELPPLRKRTEDIPLLIHHFLSHFADVFQKQFEGIDKAALRLCLDYSWPGNVRELKHVIECACVSCKTGVITPDDLPSELTEPQEDTALAASHPGVTNPNAEAAEILRALIQAKWNKSRAAELLGINRRTLYRRMAKYPSAVFEDPTGDGRQ